MSAVTLREQELATLTSHPDKSYRAVIPPIASSKPRNPIGWGSSGIGLIGVQAIVFEINRWHEDMDLHQKRNLTLHLLEQPRKKARLPSTAGSTT